MKKESRPTFSAKRKKWFLRRDKNKCQFPIPHKCDLDHPLQIHHILPHSYLHYIKSDISADYPENGITLCRTAHEMIHPDVVWARNCYHLDNDIFQKLREKRKSLLNCRKVYWVDKWDRMMTVVALINTQRYQKKHPFPVYTKRKLREENSQDPFPSDDTT